MNSVLNRVSRKLMGNGNDCYNSHHLSSPFYSDPIRPQYSLRYIRSQLKLLTQRSSLCSKDSFKLASVKNSFFCNKPTTQCLQLYIPWPHTHTTYNVQATLRKLRSTTHGQHRRDYKAQAWISFQSRRVGFQTYLKIQLLPPGDSGLIRRYNNEFCNSFRINGQNTIIKNTLKC